MSRVSGSENGRNSYFDDALELSDSENPEASFQGRDEDDDFESHPNASHVLETDDDDLEADIQVGEDEEDLEDDPIHSGFGQSREQERGQTPEPKEPLSNSRSSGSPEEARPTTSRPKTSRVSRGDMGHDPTEDNLSQKVPIDTSQFTDPSLDGELKELFKHIGRFKPQDMDLETELKPFLPDFIPAIGDIDAFIKIGRPDQKPDKLGLAILDEPAVHQSDPSVLDLHLRAVTKASSATPRTIRSLDATQLRRDPKALNSWLKNIKDLHSKKPPASVHYTRRMPDIEDLMQVWPEPVEEALKSIQLPTPDIDLPLADYAQIVALLLDIPVSPPQQKIDNNGRKLVSGTVIEGLHVLFTLYSEFKNSAHFKAMDRNTGPQPGMMTPQ